MLFRSTIFKVNKPLGIGNELLAQLFQRTLTGAAMKWFVDLEDSHKKTWDDICNAFNRQYRYNLEVDITRRDLETTCHDPILGAETVLGYW